MTAGWPAGPGTMPTGVPLPPARPRRKAPKTMSGAPFLLVLVVLGISLVAGLVALGNGWGDDAAGDDARGADEHDYRIDLPDGDRPRHERVGALADYCEEPGEAWEEVPAYADTEEAKVFLWDLGVTPTSSPAPSWYFVGGPVRVSPRVERVVGTTAEDMAGIRAVGCLETTARVDAGSSCRYENPGGEFGSYFELGLTRYVYRIVVYELRTGEPMTLGELKTRDSCPTSWDESSDRFLANSLDEATVMAWLVDHFVDGQPR